MWCVRVAVAHHRPHREILNFSVRCDTHRPMSILPQIQPTNRNDRIWSAHIHRNHRPVHRCMAISHRMKMCSDNGHRHANACMGMNNIPSSPGVIPAVWVAPPLPYQLVAMPAATSAAPTPVAAVRPAIVRRTLPFLLVRLPVVTR